MISRPDTSLDLDGIMFLYNILPTKGISGQKKLLEGRKLLLHWHRKSFLTAWRLTRNKVDKKVDWPRGRV